MHNLGLKLNWLRLKVAMSHSRGFPIEGPRTPRLSTASHRGKEIIVSKSSPAECLITKASIQRRTKAASMAWFIFRSFWYNKIDQRLVKLVFRGIVVSILLSGLAAFVLRHKDTEHLNKFMLQKGRKLMQGRACIKTKGCVILGTAWTWRGLFC